ncbi:DUF1385 domain-containing protein [Fusibacter bizertensis]
MSEYKPVRPNSIGGQALIEGVMMRGKDKIAMAVRKPDGEIEVKIDEIKKGKNSAFLKLPIVRGVVALISSMVVGVRALTYSAEFFVDSNDEAEKGKFESWLYAKFGKKADDIILAFSILFAFVFAMLLFGAVPTGIVSFLRKVIDSNILLSAIEGLMKIVIFVVYILVISQMKDIKRVFQYHGAEHKTIHCYESGKDVTVENARGFSTLHPRCGTSFIFFVLMISIIIFTFISWENVLTRLLTKLILFPIVAGLSFEMIRLAGRSNHPIVRALSYPGLMMQKITTNEPDDKQLEVAIVAFKSVLDESDPNSATF